MATREQPKRTYKLDEAVAFVLEPNSDSDMSDLEDSEDDEYIPDIVEREMDDDDGDDDEVDENKENDLLMSDEASENNEDKCENATISRLTFFCFVCISQEK